MRMKWHMMFTKKVAENFTVQMNEKVIKNTCTLYNLIKQVFSVKLILLNNTFFMFIFSFYFKVQYRDTKNRLPPNHTLEKVIIYIWEHLLLISYKHLAVVSL
jgi:hypothetical protein